MNERILIVDDEVAIKSLLSEFLNSCGYRTDVAGDGVEALEKLKVQEYSLVLSDINMPRMRGFELLKEVREKYPNTRRALITAYDVNDYIELAMEHDIGNIIPKSVPMKFDDIEKVVSNLITEEIFGLEKYLAPNASISKTLIADADSIDPVAEAGAKLIPDSSRRGKFRLVLTELFTNAVFYGARGELGDQKEKWDRNFKLDDNEAIEVRMGNDDEKVGASVVDRSGKLKKRDVLYWLNRQVSKDSQGLPVGLMDVHGRGMFLAREYVDSMVINIKPGYRTEAVVLVYNEQRYARQKPLYINEI